MINNFQHRQIKTILAKNFKCTSICYIFYLFDIFLNFEKKNYRYAFSNLISKYQNTLKMIFCSEYQFITFDDDFSAGDQV